MSAPMRTTSLFPRLLLVGWVGFATACGASPPSAGTPPGPPADPDPSAPRACTEMGCVEGFVIDFEPSSAWPAGAYELAITIDGALTTCTGRLPLSACDAPSFSCTSNAVQLGESGCAIEASSHGLSGLQFDRSTKPKEVVIAISRDGAPVVNATFTPTYKRVQPNGEGCEPVCDQAVEKLKVF